MKERTTDRLLEGVVRRADGEKQEPCRREASRRSSREVAELKAELRNAETWARDMFRKGRVNDLLRAKREIERLKKALLLSGPAQPRATNKDSATDSL